MKPVCTPSRVVHCQVCELAALSGECDTVPIRCTSLIIRIPTRAQIDPRAAKERKCVANVSRKYLATHSRVSARFGEAQASLTTRQLAEVEAKTREVR